MCAKRAAPVRPGGLSWKLLRPRVTGATATGASGRVQTHQMGESIIYELKRIIVVRAKYKNMSETKVRVPCASATVVAP